MQKKEKRKGPSLVGHEGTEKGKGKMEKKEKKTFSLVPLGSSNADLKKEKKKKREKDTSLAFPSGEKGHERGGKRELHLFTMTLGEKEEKKGGDTSPVCVGGEGGET